MPSSVSFSSFLSLLLGLFQLASGFPGGAVVKNLPAHAGDVGSVLGLKKIPWRRKWQLTPVFLPGKSHGERSLVGYRPWGLKESGMTERLSPHTACIIYLALT